MLRVRRNRRYDTDTTTLVKSIEVPACGPCPAYTEELRRKKGAGGYFLYRHGEGFEEYFLKTRSRDEDWPDIVELDAARAREWMLAHADREAYRKEFGSPHTKSRKVTGFMLPEDVSAGISALARRYGVDRSTAVSMLVRKALAEIEENPAKNGGEIVTVG